MNKQELINHIKDQNEWLGNHRFILIKKEELISMIEDIDQPQKIKVPEFVAEWIETAKKEKRTLHYSMQDIDDACYYHKGDNPLYRWMFVCDDSSEHQEIFARAWLDGYEVEESKWAVKEGDLVIRKGCHEAKVYFVESVDEDGILLVNGIKDEFFTDGPERAADEETLSYFYGNFRLLAKKESLEVEKVEE